MNSNKIVIDEKNKLIFETEEELYEYFTHEIKVLEEEFLSYRAELTEKDIPESKFSQYEENLTSLLEDPDEIWEISDESGDAPLAIYIKSFSTEKQSLYHVALCYLTDDIPSFVYLHFPTFNIELVNKYKKGDLVYDEFIKNAPAGAIEGDALLSGDRLALGLYGAMLKLRSLDDFIEDEFYEYAGLREESIEEADEIWRRNDSMGNVLVSFIKEFQINGVKVFYVSVTIEDQGSNSHALMFSFPTRDASLVSRYRQGENLQAEGVSQESSH